MKRKLLAVGLLSLCCLAMFAGTSQAFFGLFHHWHSPWHHHNRYVTHITCRPYNAFTPICWGNLNCDGCCPSFGGGGGCMPMSFGPPMGFGGCYGGGCHGDACGVSDMGAPKVVAPPTPNPNPNFVPPVPQPMPTGPNFGYYYPPIPGGVTQANYYPMYYPQPMAYPNYFTPMYYPQPMPYYWYGAGR